MFRRQPRKKTLSLNKPRKSTSYRLQGTDTRPCRHVYLASTLPGFILGLGLLVAGPMIMGSEVSAVDYTMKITTSGSRSVNVAPRADGVGTSISADNINVQTTCRAGYNLTVSTSVNDNNLYLDGDIANNTSGTFFSPASGSSTLKNSPNTWGYLVSDTAPNENSTFSPVPVLGTTATIKTPVSSTSDIDDHFNVYYGVSVANAMNTGTYKMIPDTSVTPNKDGAIVYYLTMADACTSYTVHFEPTGADNNGVLRTGTGTVADQSIKEGMATALTTRKFTAPSGYYFAGWNTAQDGSGTSYTSGQQVTDLAAVGQTITLYAQWTDCPSRNICYRSNANGDTIEGTMPNQTGVSSNSTAILQAYNYKRTDSSTGEIKYAFLGWSTKSNPTIGTDTIYGPMETIPTGDVSTAGMDLYAVWLEKDASETMQTFTTSDCQNLTQVTFSNGGDNTTVGTFTVAANSFIALRDERDNDVYAVARLTDGNCWMLENLRLDDSVSTSTIASGSQGVGGNFTRLPASVDTAWNSNTSNNLYGADTTTYPDADGNTYTAYTLPQLNKNNTNIGGTNASGTTLTPSYNSNTDSDEWYGYGNYYSWAAAMANTNSLTSASTSEEANTSICPKGWRLPYGNSSGNGVTSGGFSYLSTSMDGASGAMNTSSTPTGAVMGNRLRQFPNNFIYSGDWGGSSALVRGSIGFYWSRSASSSTSAYYLIFNSTAVTPGTNGLYKYYGYSVRCLSQ